MKNTQKFELVDAHKAFDVPDPFTNTKGDEAIPERELNSGVESFKWVLHGKEYRPIKVSGGFMEPTGHGLKKSNTFYIDEKNPDPKQPNKRNAGGHYNIGIDYVLGGDKLVVPWYGGTVEKSGLNGSYGNSVTVRTDRSYEYNGKRYPIINAYSHLEYVSKGIIPGTRVDSETFIGKMGGTGRGGAKLYPEHVDFQSYIEVDGKKIQLSPNLVQNNLIKQSQNGTFYEPSNASVNEASPAKSIAMQRYEAIAEILEQGGIQKGGSDWNQAVVRTAIDTDLDIGDVKDIAKQIPGVSPDMADKLVGSNAKNAQAELA
jgi:murein DD-endopeptidase MepM/ murein hydrolase activator NlpD